MDHDILQLLDRQRYHEAFDILVERYKDKVFRLAYAMLGNEPLAYDAAQDAFIRVWKGMRNYRGDASLSTWIYTIARNTCLTARKSACSRPAFSLEDPQIRLLVERSNQITPLAPLRSNLPDIMALLPALPPQYRTVLVLFYLEERSQEEVATMLDLPLGTVKTYLHRARKALAAAYAESRSSKGVV